MISKCSHRCQFKETRKTAYPSRGSFIFIYLFACVHSSNRFFVLVKSKLMYIFHPSKFYMKIKSQLIGIKTVDGQSSIEDAEEENVVRSSS